MLFFGLQYYLKKYLCNRITQDQIDTAERFASDHGVPFNKTGWQHILDNHNGFLPVRIRAIPEGSVVPIHNCLLTIENTDPICYWLPSHLETSILRSCWYGTSVATTSWRIKKLLEVYSKNTSDSGNNIDYSLVDFGSRGVSSLESAMIGGAAHLINFKATDTIVAIQMLKEYYHAIEMPGYSIPASEHSSCTSWGRDHEVDAYRNMILKFGKQNKVFACVSDSYDIYNACENLWGTQLKQDVIDSGATLIIRPDSGDPTSVILKCLDILSDKFGYTINSLGYKVLNYVRLLQGDGICETEIRNILDAITSSKYSIDNLSFGMGGKLLQGVNRDTHEWAVKCSAAMVDDTWVDVYKDPIESSLKKSKRGRIGLYKVNGDYITTIENSAAGTDQLHTVFENGCIIQEYTLGDIRNNSARY